MENSNVGYKRLIITTAIWLGSCIVSIILMVLLTEKVGTIPYILYFIMPNLVIIITTSVYEGGDIFKDILGLFTRNYSESQNPNEKPDKKYGRIAIPIGILLYGFVGFLMGMYWNDMFTKLLLTYLIVGAVWGYCVYIFFQKRYFYHDNDIGW